MVWFGGAGPGQGWSFPRGARAPLPQQPIEFQLSDRFAMNFIRPVRQPQSTRIGPCRREKSILRNSGRAVCLYSAIHHAQGDVGNNYFTHPALAAPPFFPSLSHPLTTLTH